MFFLKCADVFLGKGGQEFLLIIFKMKRLQIGKV